MLLRYITAEEEEGLCVVLLFRLLDRGGADVGWRACYCCANLCNS